MGTNQYVALLRGVNVGGRNKVAMSDLRETFEASGFAEVRTYIQSGNVLFESDAPKSSLEDRVEAILERRFGTRIVVVVRSRRELRAVVDDAPEVFSRDPDAYHLDVIFLKASLPTRDALGVVELRDGVDQVWPGTGVLYFARLSSRRTQSRMGRIVGTPEYQRMTIRSWSTTTKLLDLLEQSANA